MASVAIEHTGKLTVHSTPVQRRAGDEGGGLAWCSAACTHDLM